MPLFVRMKGNKYNNFHVTISRVISMRLSGLVKLEADFTNLKSKTHSYDKNNLDQ